MPYIPTPKDIRKKYNIHKDKPKTLIANRYKYYRSTIVEIIEAY